MSDLKSDSHSEPTSTCDTIPTVTSEDSATPLTANISSPIYCMKKEHEMPSGINNAFGEKFRHILSCAESNIDEHRHKFFFSELLDSSSTLDDVQKEMHSIKSKGGKVGRVRKDIENGIEPLGRIEGRARVGEGGSNMNSLKGPAVPLLSMAPDHPPDCNNLIGPTLDELFPSLADNLKKFESSVIPAWKKMKKREAQLSWNHQVQFCQKSRIFPSLLQQPHEDNFLPGMTDQKEKSHVLPPSRPPPPPVLQPPPISLDGNSELPQMPLLTIPHDVASHDVFPHDVAPHATSGGMFLYQSTPATIKCSTQNLPKFFPPHSPKHSLQHLHPTHVSIPYHLSTVPIPPCQPLLFALQTPPTSFTPASVPLLIPGTVLPLYSVCPHVWTHPEYDSVSIPPPIRDPKLSTTNLSLPLLSFPEQILQQQVKNQKVFRAPGPPSLQKVINPFTNMSKCKLKLLKEEFNSLQKGDPESIQLQSEGRISEQAASSTSVSSVVKLCESELAAVLSPVEMENKLSSTQRGKEVEEEIKRKKVHRTKQFQESLKISCPDRAEDELHQDLGQNSSEDSTVHEEKLEEKDNDDEVKTEKILFKISGSDGKENHFASTEEADCEVNSALGKTEERNAVLMQDAKKFSNNVNLSDEVGKDNLASMSFEKSHRKPAFLNSLVTNENMVDFPDKLEPLDSLEMRRLNLYHIDDSMIDSNQLVNTKQQETHELEVTSAQLSHVLDENRNVDTGKEEVVLSSEPVMTLTSDTSPIPKSTELQGIPHLSTAVANLLPTDSPSPPPEPPNTISLHTPLLLSSTPTKNVAILQNLQTPPCFLSKASEPSQHLQPSQMSVPCVLLQSTRQSQHSQHRPLLTPQPSVKQSSLLSPASIDPKHSPKDEEKHPHRESNSTVANVTERGIAFQHKYSDLERKLAEEVYENLQRTLTAGHGSNIPLESLTKDKIELQKLW